MKQVFSAALLAAITVLLTAGLLDWDRRFQSEEGVILVRSLTDSSPKPTNLRQGVAGPLLSLRAMERAMAASDKATGDLSPLEDLLLSEITTAGLGSIKIGMTLQEAQAVGLPLVPLEPNQRGECQYFRLKESLEPISFMVIDGRIIRIDVWPGSLIKTRSGAGIGSSEADILAYYPGRIEVESVPHRPLKYLTFTPEDGDETLFRLVFEVDAQGRVVKYRAGQFPAVTWAEGCS